MTPETPKQDLEIIRGVVERKKREARGGFASYDAILTVIDTVIAARDASPLGGAKPKFTLVDLRQLLQGGVTLHNVASMAGISPQAFLQLDVPQLYVIAGNAESGMDGDYQFADRFHRALWFYALSLEHGAKTALAMQQSAEIARDRCEAEYVRIRDHIRRLNVALAKVAWWARETTGRDYGWDDAGEDENEEEEITVTATMTKGELRTLLHDYEAGQYAG